MEPSRPRTPRVRLVVVPGMATEHIPVSPDEVLGKFRALADQMTKALPGNREVKRFAMYTEIITRGLDEFMQLEGYGFVRLVDNPPD